MKMLLIHSGKQLNYVQSILDTLQHQYNYRIISSSEDSTQYTATENLIVTHDIQQQNKLRSLFGGNRYNSILKKWHIDKIFLPGIFIKVETNLPQILVIDNDPFSFKEEDKNFIQKNTFSFVTYDEGVRKEIATIFPQKTIRLFNPDISKIFQPINWDESVAVKASYSDSEDYFLVNSTGQPIDYSIQLLKGFSIFKNWQKSGMKILLLTDDVQAMQHTIANYKYRDDVRIINQPSEQELAHIIAASYCTIHLPKEDSDNLFTRQSIQCNIPILLKKNSTALRWLDSHAFFIDEITTETIGQAFITMYKAENIRAHHITYMDQNPVSTVTEMLEDIL
ncbi:MULTISPECIES: hypothetical protein [Chitinophagaceae]